ncbi:MAG: thioredoxin family protein, partial [Deltaproteobacteria bacterium]|nr:thioredoxin family protein [Deltaproteobacteria bacterium]
SAEACAGTAGAAGAGATGIVAWVEGILAGGSGGSFLAFLALVFLGGLASSLTPCVYPMIPITISVIGASADQGKMKSFSLSVTYVLGIAATYTVLGLAAAYSGDLFGGMMQNPWVIGSVSVVFFLLAAAMFGFYEFALPSSLTTKASMVGGGGYGGAFIVGTVAGVVAAPCTGPIVALLLVKIASDYTVLQGVAIMLAYSLGLGQIFLAIGTFAGVMGSMAKPGAWMVEVKHIFGVVMTGVGIWYLGQILSPTVMTVLWSLFLVLCVFEMAGRMEAIKGPRNMGRVGAAVLLLLIGGFVLAQPAEDVPVEVADHGVTWGSSHDDGAALSNTAGKPMIVDFTADWCAACKELEHFTYTDPAVTECAAEFVPVMIDGTEKTPEFERLRKKYKVRGLPAVYFVCPEGEVVDELTLKGFEPADQFLTKMNKALAACGSESADAG